MDNATERATDETGIDERIAALSPEKRALLARRLVDRSGHASQRPLARAIRGKEAVELSFAQQRLWLLDRLLPHAAVYNMPKVLRLVGALDVAALRTALNEIVRRHEVLRTTFAVENGAPVQVIVPALQFALEVEDLRGLAEAERQAEAHRRVQAEAQAPFDLARGPLLRARLLRLGKAEHWMLVTLHHIISDGWSMGALWREVSTLYGAYSRGEASPLPELPVQYADYAVWQRGWFQGAVLEEQLDYWKEALAGLPVLELPTDRPRPPVASYHGRRLTFELGAELTGALRALARQEGATLFMTLLAAFQVLLYRYSGQEDLAVGVPVAGRVRPQLEGLIGFFVNTLVLRGDLSGAPSFKEYLGWVRARALEAYAHQDLPFEKLVEALVTQRDQSRNPLFQVMFTQWRPENQVLHLAGLEPAAAVAVDTETAKSDLDFTVIEQQGRCHVTAEYATDLFDAATIARMAEHWRVLLEGIVHDPKCRIGELPLLTAAERHQLLVEWNDTAADYPRDQCIQQLFEQQVERTPEAVALVFGKDQLTYREINARANQLAHHLRTLGVGPEVLVGICVERSLELVVGLLGILKAGGAYVPLDPSYPKQRLAFMLADARPKALVTQLRLIDRLPNGAAQVVCLDLDWPTIATQPQTNPRCVTTADNVAYVIYTSGSTGNPKGVVSVHRAFVNRCHWMWELLPFGPNDVCCQKTAVSFVDSVWEIFGPLLHGVKNVIIPDDVLADPVRFVETLSANSVTRIVLVPSLLRALLDTDIDLDDKVPKLSIWICSGETLPADLLRRFHDRLSRRTMLNLYGSSEVAADATWYSATPEHQAARVPIGRPIANTQTYVLDANRELVPVGVPGELFVGGDGLARGYLRRTELTADRFVPNRFSVEPGAYLFRTGDRAQYSADGNLEFLGRTDFQVKVRGFRIELGEIEAVLVRQPQVRDAVVQLREDTPGDPRLVAYVVTQGEPLAAAELRAALKQQLPDYMIPVAFAQLPALPLTPNGKLDRKALPAPEREYSEAEYRAPRTPMEKALADIWTEVLNRPRVGIDDNFFDLGGHSLLAVRLMSRIRFDLNIDMSVRQLFDTPTVSGLAQAALDCLATDVRDRPLSLRA